MAGIVKYPRRLFRRPRRPLDRGGGGKSEFEARRAFFTIRAYRLDGLAGIFEGFEGIFVPAGSGLGTYELDD